MLVTNHCVIIVAIDLIYVHVIVSRGLHSLLPSFVLAGGHLRDWGCSRLGLGLSGRPQRVLDIGRSGVDLGRFASVSI